MTTIGDVLKVLDEAYPLSRAESWDPVGLQIGSRQETVSRLVVAHEVTPAVLDEVTLPAEVRALHKGSGVCLLVVYHPLIFRPLPNLDFAHPVVPCVVRCLQSGVRLVAMHTCLDNAPLGQSLGDALAGSLGLERVQVLQPTSCGPWRKLVVFTPVAAVEQVSQAMWQAGAGRIGNYDQASFRSPGSGTFRPLPGANPYAGEVGTLEQVNEERLEVLVPAEREAPVIAAMRAAHPYEEVAFDLIPLLNSTEAYGPARWGMLPEPISLAAFARQVHTICQVPGLRLVASGGPDAAVQRVALVPGSGASYIGAALEQHCDCLVTGDIKHHDALRAQCGGLAVLDATHVATERAAVGMLENALRRLPDIPLNTCLVQTNPFTDPGVLA